MIDELIYGAVALGAYTLFKKKPAPGTSAQSPAQPPAASDPVPNIAIYSSGVTGAFAGAEPGKGEILEKNAVAAATPERVARIKKAWQGREIPGLNHIAFALMIAARESGNSYRPANKAAASKGYPLGMNQAGFVGMYQAGDQALEEAGLIKPGLSNPKRPGYPGRAKLLFDKNSWTNLCPGGLEQYLNSPDIQEVSFAKFTNKNKIYIRSILFPGMPSTDLGGYLGAAHLTGHTGAKALANGQTRKDDNGASNAEYYRIGAKSQII